MPTESGTYTPTVSDAANVTTATPHTCYWMRVDDVVTVSGIIDVTPEDAGECQFDLSLPLPSVFTDRSDCAGVAAAGLAGESCAIHAADGKARWKWVTNYPETQNGMSFVFQYLLAPITPVPVPPPPPPP